MTASDRASFAKPEIRLGMPPTFGGTQRLPRLAGRKRGLELLLTGDPFSPARALEIGLVNAVVPHDELLPAVAKEYNLRTDAYSHAITGLSSGGICQTSGRSVPATSRNPGFANINTHSCVGIK